MSRVGLGLAATGAAVAAYRFAIRPWHLHWGATEEEAQRVLPGDEEVQRPFLCATRAITIQAPPEAVWPWLAQMGGYTRAGWYAYDWIDNTGRPSARRILPELQHLAVGDVMPTSPDGSGFRVRAMQKGRFFEPGDFIMMRKMLLGIKQRSERTFQAGKLKEAPVLVP